MPIKALVEDVMIPLRNCAVVGANDPLRTAAVQLREVYCEVETGACTEAGHRTALVLDDNQKLVGILDFKGILRVLIPEIAGGLSSRLASLEVSAVFAEAAASDLDETKLGFAARVIRNADTVVKDVMLKVRGSIDPEADLVEALKIIYRNKIVVLPVFEEGKLVGVVRDSDLFLAVAAILME
ncbi:HPP family protein [Thermodesulfobacteriota bacterium]